jgi:iron complex transport system substrate-binding protein
MISKLSAALAAAVLLAAPAASQAQLTIKDDLARPLILKAPAKRIVTLSPSLTELVYAAGAGDLVVGVDALSDYPPEAKRVPQVRTGTQFSVDLIAPLRPDLVLAWREGIRREQIEAITAYGATVFVAQARNLADIPRLLEMLGRMTGRDTSAVVSDFEIRMEAVRKANAGKPRMSAFLEIWNRPLTTISGNHILSEALEVCRAENVFGELPGTAPKVTFEDVAREDPYVIVGAGSASNADEFRENWRIRQALTAVRTNRLVYLESDAIQRPTPRTPEGISQLCATLDQVRYASAPPATMPVVAAPRTGSGGAAAPAPGASAAAAALLAKPSTPAAAGTISPPGAPTAAVQPPPGAAAPQPPAPAAAAPSQPRRPSQYGM